MVHTRHATPSGHGELLTEPAYTEWARLAEKNAADARGLQTRFGDTDLRGLRERARAETLAAAAAYSDELGIHVKAPGSPSGLMVMTGHQPELYHPGVWVKDFLLQRLSDETGGTAVDLVVDTDDVGELGLKTPCMRPSVTRCMTPLASGGPGECYACTPAPDAAAVEAFRARGLEHLGTLPAPALGRHFATFCDALEAAAGRGGDLGAVMTGARRRYESSAGTDYLELGVTRQAATPAFRYFAATILADARRFAAVMNEELRSFRAQTGIRSAAQPFPDLAMTADEVEAPFWSLAEGRRLPARVRDGVEPTLLAGDSIVCGLGGSPDAVAERLGSCGVNVVPRALTLTMFARLFVADLFIHGTGGGRYDRVTDAVIRAYMGVEPPAFAVASMTLHLPLGGHVVTDEEIAALEQRLQRLEHNPDQLLGEVEFEDPSERTEAEALVAEKCELVTSIALAGADKKTIGRRIRDVNARLHDMMAPVVRETREELRVQREARDAGEVLTDRTYPYCLWSPLEVADKVG